MLHIHNGESSAGTLRQSSIPGESFAFRDALINGPAPAGLPSDAWRSLRARHLSESYGVDEHDCDRGLAEQERVLASFAAHDEVVLWFEPDLFCQVNLLYLLDWFSQQELGAAKLSLICPDQFPGVENFSGLGQLNVDQLASLFPSRQLVTHEQLSLGAEAWAAYCSPDPTAVETLLGNDLSVLPFLSTALRTHLARFPSVKNGLGRIEQRGLELIDGGDDEFVSLFPKFMDAEPVYGLGDFQFYLALKRLSTGPHPLLTANRHNGGRALDSNEIRQSAFAITEQGVAVLKGEADFVELNGIDQWLGGVHLSSEGKMWRWNEAGELIVDSNSEANELPI